MFLRLKDTLQRDFKKKEIQEWAAGTKARKI